MAYLELLSVVLWSSLSGGETGRGHPAGPGDAVCPDEERLEAVSPDPLQPVPQDQRQAGWHQQHPRAEREVRSSAPWWRF